MSERYSSLANTKTSDNHAVIILASGLSQRLGQPKQLLKRQGQPLITYMTKLALATQPQTLIVVIPSHNQAISAVMSEIAKQNASLQIVLNSVPEVGMAHSLSLAIQALKSSRNVKYDRVLIIGVDQVLLDSNHLQHLLAGTKTVVASSYFCIDNPSITNKLTDPIVGLPLVIDYDLLSQWQPLLKGDKGLRHLLRALPCEQVSTVNNPHLSYDIDTPAQLSYAREQGWLDKDL